MSCRETGAGSCLTSYARFSTGRTLSDPATLSCFHELVRNYNNQDPATRRTYTTDDYTDFLSRQEMRIRNMPTTAVTDRERTSLLNRLERARHEATPDQAVIYALRNITPNIRDRANAINQYLDSAADRMGITREAMRTRFAELEAGTVRSRSTHPDTWTEENRRFVTDANMGRDVGVVNAISRIEEEVRAVETTRFRAAPQRIERAIMHTPVDGLPGIYLTGQGYDPVTRRLEVEIEDSGTTRVFAYRNVPVEVASQFAFGAGNAWTTQVRGNADYQYPNERDAAEAGVAMRCDRCGEFATTSHACQVQAEPRELYRWTTGSRWSRQAITVQIPRGRWHENGHELVDHEVKIALPAIREFREAVAAGPVTVQPDFQYFQTAEPVLNDAGEVDHYNYISAAPRGKYLIYREEDGTLVINTSSVRCNCATWRETGHCVHIDYIGSAIRTRLDPPPRSAATPGVRRGRMTAAERTEMLAEAQQRSEAIAASSDWMLTDDAREEAARTWRDDAEVIYANDFDAFYTQYETVKERMAAKDGRNAIPYMTENALDGIATRASGKGFGMEIEFDIKAGTNTTTAIRAIAQELYDAGITQTNVQDRYQASQRRGVTDKHTDANGKGTWSYEHDGSVNGGELVTPIMYDEPETWEKLAKAVEIIKRHGGVPSKRAGAHVHVGTGEYTGDTQSYAELGRLMTQHEDVIYRLGTDPGRGTWRNNGYSKPLPAVPAEGFENATRIRRWSSDRYRAINFAHVNGTDGDHPEFRLWDSTLDPGAMQAQIKLSVAMTEAARRVRGQGGTNRPKEPMGAHAARFAARGTRVPLTKSELEADTRTLRSFLDTVFRRKDDKDQMLAIFASTKWSRSRGR